MLKFSSLIIKSIRCYWRTSLGVVLSVSVCTAVLTGALIVGDSVPYSLNRIVYQRLGRSQFAMVQQRGFFTESLTEKLADDLHAQTAAMTYMRGLVASPDESKVAGQVNVYAVDSDFYSFFETEDPFENPNEIVFNPVLAEKLNISVGDQVILTLEKPSSLSYQALTLDTQDTLRFSLTVKAIAGDDQFGRFNLNADQAWPLNAFVPLKWLQEQLEMEGKVNLCLLAGDTYADAESELVNRSVQSVMSLEDTGLSIEKDADDRYYRVRSDGVFIDQTLSAAIMQETDKAVGILTYFVNGISTAEASTPYSMVSAVTLGGPYAGLLKSNSKDGIVLVDWLAEDLHVGVHDDVQLTYYILTDTLILKERTQTFQVESIIPLETPGVDMSLMPDFPGLKDVDNCRDWQSPVPIELDRIREKDEEYWDRYQGTPKAFVSLQAGQSMWSNFYGNMTEIRIPTDDLSMNVLSESILSRIDAASLGLFFMDVRRVGIQAAAGSTDFAQLFLGLSMFLIASSLVLLALTFILGLEHRMKQVGILKALGIPKHKITVLYLSEGLLLAVAGSLAGLFLGILYSKLLMIGLSSFWQTAIANTEIEFSMTISSLATGFLLALFTSGGIIWLCSRRLVNSQPHRLLNGQLQWQYFSITVRKKIRSCIRVLSVVITGMTFCLIVLGARSVFNATASFFIAGSMFLIIFILAAMDVLKQFTSVGAFGMRSCFGFAVKNSGLRHVRSLTVIAMTAVGVFMIVSVGSNKTNPLKDVDRRLSGTGGFDYLAQSSVGISQNLNTDFGKTNLGFSSDELQTTKFVNMRVHQGDDASCMNLNRAQMPSVLGVDPRQLAELEAFRFTQVLKDSHESPWMALYDRDLSDDVIPAIADAATVTWALGKSIGDEINAIDQQGRHIKYKLVAALKNSVLQGALIISNDAFLRHFPSESDFRMFLIDTADQDQAAELLADRLRDYGFEIMPAAKKLEQFAGVQNTYITIFQLLGSLGLILGTAGLALVLIRNVFDRKGELAMLQAVGFNHLMIRKIIIYEHAGLLLYGILAGAVSALIAVIPALKTTVNQVSFISLSITILLIFLSGLIWIWLSAGLALKGSLLDALRNE